MPDSASRTLFLFAAMVLGNAAYYFFTSKKDISGKVEDFIRVSFMQGVAMAIMYFEVVLH